MKIIVALLLNYSVILLVIIFSQMIKYKRSRCAQAFMWICCLTFITCLLEALAYTPAPKWCPMWLYRALMVLDYTIGDLSLIAFLSYSYFYISERTSVNKNLYKIPAVLLFIGLATTVTEALSGGVFEIVDNTCYETTGKPIASLIEILVIPYLPILPFSKRKEIGTHAVFILGLFGFIPLIAIIAHIAFDIYDYSIVAMALSIFIMYITLENKLAEENEHRERMKAEEANKAKSRFLFNMSHDIRTPMNAIVGYTKLIDQNLDNKEKMKDYLSKVNTSSHFLLGLINNVLEMSRIESGKMVIEEKPCNVQNFLDEIRDISHEATMRKNITYIAVQDIKVKSVYIDAVKVQQIFLNIISNAVKYTPEGGTIEVRAQQKPSKRHGYVGISVSITDNGIGMSKEFLPHVFDEFMREKTSTESKIEGTGLGLPIVKKLVEMMGGTITVESEQGKGSTFHVKLELRVADETMMEEVVHKEATTTAATPVDNTTMEDDACGDGCKEKEVEGKRILLAEDNELNAEIAIELISDMGIIVDRVEDGQQCLEKIITTMPGYYDMILMDVQMPNMDGYEATRYIRRLNDPAKANIPIYAMTANAFEEDKRNAMDAGMNGHLSKPIDLSVLMSTMRQVLGSGK